MLSPFPNPSRHAIGLVILLTLSCASPARALIVYENSTSIDNTFNTTAPTSGAPWTYVAQVGTPPASAVYLGNGFVLTADHINPHGLPIKLGSSIYQTINTFGTPFQGVQIRTGGATIDLRLFKISSPPTLPAIALPSKTFVDTGKSVTMIGSGLGKGAILIESGKSGWLVSTDNSTRVLRWGLNYTDATYTTITYNAWSYPALVLPFDPSPARSNEGYGTTGDSGGGIFQKSGTTWYLTGTITTVSNTTQVLSDGTYGTFAVPLAPYSWLFRYDHWKTHHTIISSTPDTDDSDGDGIPLLVEYALAMNPKVNSTAGLPSVRLQGANVELTCARLMSTTDIEVSVEQSDNLTSGGWSPATATWSVVSKSDEVWTMKATVPMNGATKKFLRLKITKL